MTNPQRSPAAVKYLEHLQLKAIMEGGEHREPEKDLDVIRQIAEQQIILGQIDDLDSADPIGSPAYEEAVAERVRDMLAYFAATDGDLWSRYERPDRRKRLSDLVVRVESAATSRGYRIPHRPAIGTLPTFEINARAMSGPLSESHIIVFDSGIFVFATCLSKVMAQVIDGRIDEGGFRILGTEEMVLHVASRANTLVKFTDLLFSQAILGTCMYATVYPVAPEYDEMVAQLHEAHETFTLAHEYAHIIHGHSHVHSVSADAHEQELAADRTGLDIASAWNGALWGYVGASLFLAGREAVERAVAVYRTGKDEIAVSASHPSYELRRDALEREIKRLAPAEAARALEVADRLTWALQQLTGFTLPAFEHAHRSGTPPQGYRPQGIEEKTAALHAFISAGLPQLLEGGRS